MEDVRALPLSEFDCFVRSVQGQSWAASYRRVVTKLFLAQRFSLGFAEVIGVLDMMIRVVLCCVAAFQIQKWTAEISGSNILGCLPSIAKDGDWSACFKGNRVELGEWLWLAQGTISIFACHGYGMIKGYR